MILQKFAQISCQNVTIFKLEDRRANTIYLQAAGEVASTLSAGPNRFGKYQHLLVR